MKQVLISALVAAVVCGAVFLIEDRFEDDDDDHDAMPVAAAVELPAPPVSLRYTVEPTEDSWVSGARGSGTDERLLSDAANSICFLTKIEIKGTQGPDDAGMCRIEIDDFTGFWQVTADVPEGSRSDIRCNARCLVWE
jgi:hypothetical protein